MVLKANVLPLSFSGTAVYQLHGRCCPDVVPRMLAFVEEQNRRWAVFSVFNGDLVGSIGALGPLLDVARTDARIQTAVAAWTIDDAERIPSLSVLRMPELFDELTCAIHDRFLVPFGGDEAAFALRHALPSDAVVRLGAARPAISSWASEAASGGWPAFIHHVDLHPNNAVRLSNGDLLIVDWEEADLGFPFFVLDKLLMAAGEGWGAPGAAAVRDAYLDELPWGTRERRERAFAVAQLLAPIRSAYADLRFADAMRWDPAGQVV